ncbi:MAG: hypothetical protein EHM14_08625 [Methanothrix sp.]|nr:MAG: hypothetical protein EHM14_08625 [Methanothrix sp.]
MKLLQESTDLNVSGCILLTMPQKITLITRPTTAFEVPVSEGYQLYSAVLGVMREADETISKHAHDSPISSMSIGRLDGRVQAMLAGQAQGSRSHAKIQDENRDHRPKVGGDLPGNRPASRPEGAI